MTRLDRVGHLTLVVNRAQEQIGEADEHGEDEEIYMISGDLSTPDETLVAGDYHRSRKGTRHADAPAS